MENQQGNKLTRAISSLSGGEAYGARWTLGCLLLAPLAAANYSYCAVPAVLLLGSSSTVAALTCKDLKKLAEILPPPKTARGRRERNLRSFGDFMGFWMSFLSHLVAVAICARILSATADHVTEGRTRRWLFGYETRDLGEPWPDALGVTVIIVVCAMFMCGLEENAMFTSILLGLLYIFSQFFAIFGIINLDITNVNMKSPITAFEVIAAAAPVSYAFSVVVPSMNRGSLKRSLVIIIAFPTLVFTTICFLYTNILKGTLINAALPVTTLIEARLSNWICPVLAAITVTGVGLAFTDLCPILFDILVNLASPEWKVITRSMTYESTTTGSRVLAVFTAGSLAAILAFACPLTHMITLLNASHLIGIAIQGLQFMIMRCAPTTEQREAGDVEYKRLGVPGPSRAIITSAKTKRGFWFIPASLRHTKTLDSIKSKVSKAKEERECLLLDEYSGCATEEIDVTSSVSNITAEVAAHEADNVPSDVDPSDNEASSGDDSTDIDAVVKEYRDTVQVVTSRPEAAPPQPPSVRGAKLSALGSFIQLAADAFLATALCNDKIKISMFATGFPLWLFGIALTSLQPCHNLGPGRWRNLQGPVTLLMATLFLTPLLLDSWPAIILFAGAGVVIYARCDRWCGDLAVHQARSALERRKLHEAPEGDLTGARVTRIDTVYISRLSWACNLRLAAAAVLTHIPHSAEARALLQPFSKYDKK